MDPNPKTKGLRLYPRQSMKFRAYQSCKATRNVSSLSDLLKSKSWPSVSAKKQSKTIQTV